MPDKYTKFLMHGNSDRTDFSLGDKTVVTSDQKIIGSHSIKCVPTDESHLSWLDSSDWTLGTNNWTMEGWFRFSNTGVMGLFSQIYNDDNRYQVGTDSTEIGFYYGSGGTRVADYRYNWNYAVNTWYHIALVRNGGSMLLFIDGDLKTWSSIDHSINASTSFSNINARYVVGRHRTSGDWRYMNGYIDGFRFSKGVARYTSNFTPETERFDSDSYTKILFYADDLADVSDSAHQLQALGINCDYRTGKFNNCPYFNGSNYLATEPSEDWDIGTQDITIELWAKLAVEQSMDFLGYVKNSNNFWKFYYTTGDHLLKIANKYNGDYTVFKTTSWTPTLNTWYHLVLVKKDNVYSMYINGERIYTSVADTSPLNYYDDEGILTVGSVSGYYMNGYLDEVKLSVGIARYSSNFTPPTRPEDDFKIEGTLSKAADVYLIDEDTGVLERAGTFNSGVYDFVYVSSGRKFIAARADDDGEGKAFGDVVPVTLSGSEVFVDRFTGNNNEPPNSTYWSVNNSNTYIYENRLRQSFNNSNSTATYLATLTNNFDIEIDQTIVVDATSGVSYGYVRITQQDTGHHYSIQRINESGTKYLRFIYYDGTNDYTDVPNTNLSNKLKLTRFGSTVHLYYWNGTSWVEPKSFTDDASGNMTLTLVASSGASLTVDWDNFIRYAIL